MTDETKQTDMDNVTDEELYSINWVRNHVEEAKALIDKALNIDDWSSSAQVFMNKIQVRNEALSQEIIVDLNRRLNELTLSHAALLSILTEAGILRSVPDDVPSEVLN